MKTFITQPAVPREVLRETSRCFHGFTCLTLGKCGSSLKCTIEKKYDRDMLIVRTEKDSNAADAVCPYRYSYGRERKHICTCPTHYALYEQNKKRL